MTTLRICYLSSRRVRSIFPSVSLIEGRFMRRLDVERGRWRPRPAHRPYRVEVQETRSSGQYDPGGEQGRRPTPEGIPDNGKHGHGPQNRHGGAPQGERFLFSGNARRRNKAPACRSWHAKPGASQASVAPVALTSPSMGVENKRISGVRRREEGEGRE